MIVPTAIRAELRAHAQAEAPNECCGLVLFRAGVAERYIPGENRLRSPYRYELYVDPLVWAGLDDDLEQAIFHSHPETKPIPSTTDKANTGLWANHVFLIYGLALDELRAWRFDAEHVEEIPLAAA